jgi:hypothetical protein
MMKNLKLFIAWVLLLCQTLCLLTACNNGSIDSTESIYNESNYIEESIESDLESELESESESEAESESVKESESESAPAIEYEDPTLLVDFETSVSVSAFNLGGSINESISVDFADGNGVEGSKAIAVSRPDKGNSEIRISTDKTLIGKNKYLMFWIDLKTNSIDFRKASGGIITEYGLYTTDNNDGQKVLPKLYVKADGKNYWTSKKHGSDGCFGLAENSSVAGYKGWVALPLCDMLDVYNLTQGTYVTGYYLYFDYAQNEGKEFYLDNFMLVEDYTTVYTGDYNPSSMNPGKAKELKEGGENIPSIPNIPAPDEVEMDINLDEVLNNKMKLTVGDNEDFKVLVLTDLHLYAASNAQMKLKLPVVLATIKKMIDRENPDLIILDGDTILDYTNEISNDNAFYNAIKDVVSLFEQNAIPWVHVYGNHDAEFFSKERQQAIYESFDYCLSKSGPSYISGIGNYVIPIYAEDGETIKFAVWGLDSGAYLHPGDYQNLPGKPGWDNTTFAAGYDYIKVDQINWYQAVSKALQQRNNGVPVPGLMAFHIALQESSYAWDHRDVLPHSGEKNEAICASPFNTGMFSAIVERGDIKAVVNGHDHINTFMVEYRGVKLCQAGKLTALDYHDEAIFGARVFTFNGSNPKEVDTYMSYLDGRIERYTPPV